MIYHKFQIFHFFYITSSISYNQLNYIRVQSLENVFIKKDNHESRSKLVLLFKGIWGYPGKNQKQIKLHKVFKKNHLYGIMVL